MTTTRPTSAAPTTRGTGALQALRVFSALSVLSVLFQYVTAGQLFPHGGPESLHADGAIALHVLSGLAAVCAVLWWRRGGSTVAPAVLAVVVFVLSFVQAAVGGRDTLWIHVPGAMVLTAGVVWLLVWSLRAPAAR